MPSTHLTAAVNIKRADADSLNLLGAALVQVGEPKKAIEALKRAVAFVPLGWIEPYTTIAQAYARPASTARAEWANAMADLSVARPTRRGPACWRSPRGRPRSTRPSGWRSSPRGAAMAPRPTTWYTKALAIEPDNAEARLGPRPRQRPDGQRRPASGPAATRHRSKEGED